MIFPNPAMLIVILIGLKEIILINLLTITSIKLLSSFFQTFDIDKPIKKYMDRIFYLCIGIDMNKRFL